MAIPGTSIEEIEDAGGIIALCRRQMENALPIAVRTMIELAQSAEKENVRLAAAGEIMERAGMPKRQEITHKVDPKEHEAADREALELVEALSKNKGVAERNPIAIETAIVLEGDEDDEPPLAAPDTYADVIDVEEVPEPDNIVLPIQL